MNVSACGSSFLLGLIYRPPGLDPSLSELETLLGSLNLASYSFAMLLGDFNVNILDVDSSVTTNLLGLTSSLGLHQIVTQPTRLSTNCSSLLDHVYVTSSDLVNS